VGRCVDLDIMRYFALLFLFGLAFGQINAITTEGKIVILNSDGSWEYATDNLPVSTSNSIWKAKYFVDDFGDQTDDGYITTNLKGTFSNSATTNSKLGVRFIIDETVAIKLYEYDQNHPISGKISAKLYKIMVKHNGERTPDFIGRNHSDRLVLNENDSKKIIELFKAGGSFIFNIEESLQYSSGSYRFKIQDASGFDSIWQTLFVK